ncbi:hypothetical protein NicSoilE8_41640 (plasmid) [Arthrobacter sp. NicSoilE8]|nr:hypothetical protein NicSoilE8_41640 [Arthrobacter sp. NicSoilE8]
MNATPVFEMVDPATVRVGINVRKDAALTPDFVANIKQHGVLEAVTLYRTPDGTLEVYKGQRRTLAAVEAGLTTMPAMIVDTPEDAERIVLQLVENIHRAEMTAADEADAYHQLSLFGVSAAAIAKKTGRTKTTVEGALKAKASEAGTTALGKGYTIEEALILAEFESDEEATLELESVIQDEPDQLFHVAQRIRDNRTAAAALAAFTAELEAAGTTVVAAPGYYDDETARVSSLKRADGEPATEDDGNAVYIALGNSGEHITVPVIVGWKELGFKPRYGGSPSESKGPMTEEQKAERKTLIANNKAAESATTVRRDWVKTLLAKKQAPKGWQYFTVHAITHHAETARSYDGEVAADMVSAKIDGEKAWAWNPLRDHVAKTTTRPEFSLIALVCAGYESTMAKDAWRTPSQTHRDYLNQLVTWGYVPSEVEQIIIDSDKPAPETDETKDTEETAA